MSMCSIYHRPVLSPKLPKFPGSRCKFAESLHLDRASGRIITSSFHLQGRRWEMGHLTAAMAAASAPLDGSSAEYLEQLTKSKDETLAGIGQDEIEDPVLLADADSCFCEFNGVQIHHKLCDGELSGSAILNLESAQKSSDGSKVVNFPIILLHGFGASVFSWDKIMKPLALMTGSKVLAFDRPAFGLTSRMNAIKLLSHGNQDSKPLNPFSMAFSVLASLFFVDLLSAEKAILVGHSAGALVAVDAYFEEPERIAALILVAPAIFAPLMQSAAKQQPLADSNPNQNLFSWLLNALSTLVEHIATAILNIVGEMACIINSLYRNFLASFLRSSFGVMVVRIIINKFGREAVRTAWYDRNQVSDHVLQGYTKPLKMKFWDKALAEFVVAMLSDPASESKLPLGKRLSQISCPVLIVSGDTDRLVPLWNSERLSNPFPDVDSK